MSRITDDDSSQIFTAAEHWRNLCLIEGKSLLWSGHDIWSAANLQRFKACFIDRPDTSKDKDFEVKFKEQLATETEDVTRLACELLFIYFLFPASVSAPRKKELIRVVAGWKNIALDGNDGHFVCFNSGIGDPGLVYNTGRPNELT